MRQPSRRRGSLRPLIAVPAAQSGRRARRRPAAGGEYVKGYEGMALVAQEEYTQLAALGRRNLQSDILFMKDDSFGWVEFRDVGLSTGRRCATGRIGC